MVDQLADVSDDFSDEMLDGVGEENDTTEEGYDDTENVHMANDDPNEEWVIIPNFWISNHWRRDFLRRWGLSLFGSHPKRRSMPNEVRRVTFIITMI